MRNILPNVFRTTLANFQGMSRIGRATFVALSLLMLAEVAVAIVNGTNANNPDFQAVVSFGGCTGTFVHPRFILTAAHCLPQCANTAATGCVTGSPQDVVNGDATGRDGSMSGPMAFDGSSLASGKAYPIDFVYFPRAQDLGNGRAPDVALLRTTTPFAGKIIPVLPSQDLPRPDENNYCPRWEYTWPRVLGYSDNAGTATARRRVGRAFAECDLEKGYSVFKLDGHGRPGQRGIRICKGDSGGPVLWQTGFGGFAVGGINSATDAYKVLTDTHCPSERGEGFHAFIPAAFLNRVAQSDALCRNARNWGSCPGVPPAYGGYQLRYLDTTIDQCGQDSLVVPSTQGSPITIRPGETRAVEVPAHRFGWRCGGTQEWTTAERGTRLVVVKRALTDRQIIWDCYEVLGRPPGTGTVRLVEVALGEDIDRCSGVLKVKDKNNTWVRIPRNSWSTVDVSIDADGYWRWTCDGTSERSRGERNYRWRVKRLKVLHGTSGRKIIWRSYDVVTVPGP